MSTVYIDADLYKYGEQYAAKHNVSLTKLVEDYLQSLVGKAFHKEDCSVTRAYHVSSKLRALETDVDYAANLSSDYKKEKAEYMKERFL